MKKLIRIVPFALLGSLGCGPATTLIIAGFLADSGGGGAGGGGGVRMTSAVFTDGNANGILDGPDTLTITFSKAVLVRGTPTADEVFTLDPPGTMGLFAQVHPTLDPKVVDVRNLATATLQPNGVHGENPLSSGIRIADSQTSLERDGGKALSPGLPVDISGDLHPHVATVILTDADMSCDLGAGDTLEIGFSAPVSFGTSDPTLAFDLPVAQDTLGGGAQFLGGGIPAGVATVTVVLGTGARIMDAGTFDPGVLAPGSPSGVDVVAGPGRVWDASFPDVLASPFSPPGVDVGGAGVVCLPVIVSATYDDGNENGLVDAADTIRVVFDEDVTVTGAPLAQTVFELDPPAGFGSGATVSPTADPREVMITDLLGGTFSPNGIYILDGGSSGLNMLPGQTAITQFAGPPLPPSPTTVDLGGLLHPRILYVTLSDEDRDCAIGPGDTLEVEFTAPVSFTTADPAQAFSLPVTGDGFGTGAVFAAGGAPTGVTTATVVLGAGVMITDGGVFDTATTGAGSPSGIDITSVTGTIFDDRVPSVSALPHVPAGVDIPDRSLTGGSLVSAEYFDLNDNGLIDMGDELVVSFCVNVMIPGPTPAGDNVFALFPTGGLGEPTRPSLVTEGPAPNQVTCSLREETVMEPNGIYGVDVGSTGINLKVQLEVTDDQGGALAVSPTPIDIEGTLYPRMVRVMYRDLDGSCGGVDAGDTMEIRFSRRVSFTEADPGLAFQLPVAGDSLGAGASFLGGLPTDVEEVTVVLGSGAVLSPEGWFDPGVITTGSPSGMDVAGPGILVDAVYPSVTTPPYLPPGVDVGGRPYQQWFAVGGPLEDPQFGEPVAGAGDVDGDGYDDVLVGAPEYGPPGAYYGRLYLFHGAATGLSTERGWESAGEDQRESAYGQAAAGAGDVNQDGYDDVIVSAPAFDTAETNAGKVYLFLGGPTGLGTTPAWTHSGEDLMDLQFGRAVGSAGDVDGDGYDDVLIGAPYFATVNLSAGKAYLFRGGPAGLGATPAWTSHGDDLESAHFGYSVACAGDVDSDGFDDILVGAPSTETTVRGAGKAFLFRGGVSGPEATAVWSSLGDDSFLATFGNDLSTAGDVDNDGYDDILIAAPGTNVVGDRDGKVFVFHGGPAGPSASPDWTSVGDSHLDARFGRSVACAGDLDGDGYDDVVVGASNFDTVMLGVGKVYVYRGGTTGLSTVADWTTSGDDWQFYHFGSSVDSAGDTDGDGLPEIIVGAPDFYDPFTTDFLGKAYLFCGGP